VRRTLAAAALALLGGCATPGAVPQAPPSDPNPPRFPTMSVDPPPPLPGADIVVEGAAIQGGLVRGRVPAGWSDLRLVRPGGEQVPVPVAADGAFVVGFDRDASPRALLVARVRGTTATRPIDVAPRAWPVERVDAPLRAGRTSAEFDRLRPAELAAIAAARVPDLARADPGGWRTRPGWPGQGRISGRFGAQRIYRGVPGSFHSGVDLALPAGTPVLAPADGVVTLAADRAFTLEGRLVLVDHGGGLESAFLHLSRIDVAVGDRVRRGQTIGLVGATGRATGPHLHWGLRWQGARLDPVAAAEPRAGARVAD